MHVAQGAVAGGLGRSRAGKHFVPGAEAGLLAIDDDAKFAFVESAGGAVGVLGGDSGDAIVERHGDGGGEIALGIAAQRFGAFGEFAGFGARGARGGAGDEIGADQDIDGRLLPRFDTFQEIATPRLEGIDPGLERIKMMALRGNAEARLPAVVAEFGHGDFGPA